MMVFVLPPCVHVLGEGSGRVIDRADRGGDLTVTSVAPSALAIRPV